jgi:hypothetical protein
MEGISIYIVNDNNYDWTDPKFKQSPIKIYIRKTKGRVSNMYLLHVTNVIENCITTGISSEYMKLGLQEVDENDVSILLQLGKPYSFWDILDMGTENIFNMIIGDLIELDGEINYKKISDSELADKIIEEDENNYGKHNQELRILVRVEIAIKIAYILDDTAEVTHNVSIRNKNIDRYFPTLLNCITKIRGRI